MLVENAIHLMQNTLKLPLFEETTQRSPFELEPGYDGLVELKSPLIII
jgi:hypothetical protein